MRELDDSAEGLVLRGDVARKRFVRIYINPTKTNQYQSRDRTRNKKNGNSKICGERREEEEGKGRNAHVHLKRKSRFCCRVAPRRSLIFSTEKPTEDMKMIFVEEWNQNIAGEAC